MTTFLRPPPHFLAVQNILTTEENINEKNEGRRDIDDVIP